MEGGEKQAGEGWTDRWVWGVGELDEWTKGGMNGVGKGQTDGRTRQCGWGVGGLDRRMEGRVRVGQTNRQEV